MQMTKASGFAIWAGWNGIADLDVSVGDDHPHHQPLDMLPFLLPRCLLKPLLHPTAELVDAQAHACDLAVTVDLRLQLLPLSPKALDLLLQVVTATAIFLQAHMPPLQGITPGLQILRQPMAAMRPLQRIADGLRMGQQPAQILPDQALNRLGRNKARAALPFPVGLEGWQLAATAIVAMLRSQAAAEAGQPTHATADQAP